jgi:hypothetical protein
MCSCRAGVGQEDRVSDLVPAVLLIGGFLLVMFALRFAGRGHRH